MAKDCPPPDRLYSRLWTLQDAYFFPSFVGHIFGSISDRSWFDFPSQLAFKHPPTSMKNQSQEAFCLGLQFLIDI